MKALVIVDVQYKYSNSFDKDYLEKLKNFVMKDTIYDKIILLMEENPFYGNCDFINSEIKNKLSIKPIFKDYSTNYTMEKIKNSSFLRIEDGQVYPKVSFEDGPFCINDGNGYLIGRKEDGEIYLDFIAQDLFMCLNFLRGYEIDLVGGAINLCVKKTKDYFSYLDIDSVNILTDLCYTQPYKNNHCSRYDFDLLVRNEGNS